MEPPASRNRWKQIQHIFADVVGRAPSDREERLERLCGEDRDLREAVEALLERHESGEPIGDYGDGAAVGSSPDWVSVRTPGESARAADAEEAGSLPSEAESPEGRQVGRYRLISELGRGAMGVVYRAEDMRLGRPVALKFLSPALSTDQRARARLEREARAASALDHPNICTVYEIGEAEEGQLFLALACYDGQTLEERIDAGPLAVDEAVRVAVHVARGLAAAHRHGIVHRDVKPSNILITDEGTVKLLDFGIARVADSNLTDSGDTLGTVAYMSPEQLRGEVDARADVWALGVVLHEMLTGRRPFGGDYEAAVLYAVLHEPPAPLQRDDVPSELAEIVERCLVKDPEDRYASAEEVEVALERLGLREVSQPALRRVVRRRRGLAAGLGAVACALVFLISPLRSEVVEALGFGGAPDMQHLAVLPLMAPADEASMGKGLTLTLTSLLTRLGADAEEPIRVVPASEMREITTAAEAHERFGVGVVVSGDFRQDGEEMHLTLNLIDARTMHQIDSEPLSEPVSRLPILQQRAAASLAEMLGISLSEKSMDMINAGGTADADAYRYYLEGSAAIQDHDKPENIQLAIDLFDLALGEDSMYVAAYAGLSEAYRYHYGVTRDPHTVSLAETRAQRAVALDDEVPTAHIALGGVQALRGKYSDAAGSFKLAIILDSLNADAHVGLALALQSMGSIDEAEQELRTAVRLEPTLWSHHNNLGKLYLYSGRIEEARARFQEVVRLAPDNAWGYTSLGASYLYEYQTDEQAATLEQASAYFEEANRKRPTRFSYSNLGVVAYYEDNAAEEIRMYKQALMLDSLDYATWGNLASAYDGRVEYQEELRGALQEAILLAEKRLQVNSNDAEVLVDMAFYAQGIGDLVKAQDAADRAVTLRPNDWYILDRAADVYESIGQVEKAEELRAKMKD